MSDRELAARRALAHWPLNPDVARVELLSGGLINTSFRVDTDGTSFVLQRVSPIFSPEVCDDVEKVTAHLSSRGVATPRLVRSGAGRTHEHIEDGVWRVLTYIDGVVHDHVSRSSVARAAGAALGRFHAALVDYDAPFSARRLGVHDTARHLAGLRSALEKHRDHPRFAVIEPVAEAIVSHRMPELPATTERIVHGDPKITNLIFDRETEVGKAWIDLDTVAPMALPLELGDALRSWCNRGGEDGAAELDLDLLEAALGGYAETARFVTRQEWEAFVPAAEVIALELAARFCRDALEESYFGWDPERHPTASHHHLARAEIQLALARSVAAQREEALARTPFPR